MTKKYINKIINNFKNSRFLTFNSLLLALLTGFVAFFARYFFAKYNIDVLDLVNNKEYALFLAGILGFIRWFLRIIIDVFNPYNQDLTIDGFKFKSNKSENLLFKPHLSNTSQGVPTPAAPAAPAAAPVMGQGQIPSHTKQLGIQPIGEKGSVEYIARGKSGNLTIESISIVDPQGQISRGWVSGGVNQPASGNLADVLSSLKNEDQKHITKRMQNSMPGLKNFLNGALIESGFGGIKEDQNITDTLITTLRKSN